MSGWILLLGLVVIGLGILWSTRLPPSVSVDLPDPPKVVDDPIPDAEPIVQRMFGLWAAPESHFWSDNLRVGPPSVTRDEYVPHGPRVAEQAGWTRPYESSTQTISAWVTTLRRIVVGSGVANPLDKSFATSGVVERRLCRTTCSSPPEPVVDEPIFDGGNISSSANVILDGLSGPPPGGTIADIYTGGNVDGQL